MKKGLVSVIVPVYNREDYVRETLDSILQQTYENIEVIVVNDGSTDNSLSIIEEFKGKYPEKFLIIDQENQGQVRSRNNAIEKSSGEFIAFLDSDDLWLPNKLEMQIPLFVGDVGLVYCAIYNIDADGQVIDTELCEQDIRGYIYPELLIKNRMTGGTVVLHRDAIDKVGLFDVDFAAAENWDLWIRVSKYFSVDMVNEPLVKYRKHAGNMSKDSLLMLNIIDSILIKHCSGEPATHEIEVAIQKARANYAYRRGVYHFSRYEFKASRRDFKEVLRLVPGYEDAKIRLIRSYLGPSINRLISKVKARISG
jgi:glycosyltransferase involved in cell wall biosynthesis